MWLESNSDHHGINNELIKNKKSPQGASRGLLGGLTSLSIDRVKGSRD
jgi:hypothetical protein